MATTSVDRAAAKGQRSPRLGLGILLPARRKGSRDYVPFVIAAALYGASLVLFAIVLLA